MKVLAALSLMLAASLPFAKAADEAPTLTYLRPLQEIDLASAESGMVGSVLVSPGDHVTKGAGDPAIELDRDRGAARPI